MKKLLVLLLVLALLLAACDLLPDPNTGSRAMSEQSIWAMDTQMDLRLYGDADGAVMAELTALLNELDRTFSATSANSALTALNESGRTEDAGIVYLTCQAQEISALTGGAMDITLLPVSRAWGFPAKSYRVPDAAELEALRAVVGMDRITVSDGVVTLADGTMLDFGALAKGYAADLCRAKLEEAGRSGILSLGGNIQTVGTKPDGSDWIVGVQDPDHEGRYVLTLRLTGTKAAVTSGDYQRNFTQDGVLYCHILDPGTLSPVRGTLRAVTVIADEGLLADGLSTALYVMGREAGEAFQRERGGFEAIWIEADGTVWVSPGLQDRIVEGSFEVIEP
jgi:thiamine biosynthesis lipoprotein